MKTFSFRKGGELLRSPPSQGFFDTDTGGDTTRNPQAIKNFVELTSPQNLV
jgi:hypothetical protein